MSLPIPFPEKNPAAAIFNIDTNIVNAPYRASNNRYAGSGLSRCRIRAIHGISAQAPYSVTILSFLDRIFLRHVSLPGSHGYGAVIPGSGPDTMKKKRRWLRWTVDLAVIALIFFAINAWNSRGASRGMAPEIRGELLDGTPVTLEQTLGKPMLVHFWATWCGICGLEQSTIDSLAKEFNVLTIAIDDALPGRVLIYMKEKGVSYPVIHDPDYFIAGKYGVRGVPSSFILDAKGNIRFVETGYTSEPGLRLRLWWAGRDDA